MTIVGFNFTKINAERKPVSEQNVRVENNVGIINVVEATIPDAKKSLIKFEFKFLCKYEPGIGTIELTGELIHMFDKELGTKILAEWKENKRVNKDIMARVLNHILTRANIQAIVVSRDLGLPSPIQLPKVEVKQPGVEKTAASIEKKSEKTQEKTLDKSTDKVVDKTSDKLKKK